MNIGRTGNMKATIMAYTGVIEIGIGENVLKIFVAPGVNSVRKIYGYKKRDRLLHLEHNLGEDFLWVSKFAHKVLKEITEWENIQDREYPPDYCI
ncbi:hypothetical protein FACS1894120_2050 [Clostridia bacterium]|nr:hypothetical protein FACS1894120_2050 [Clostridia bacterium]